MIYLQIIKIPREIFRPIHLLFLDYNGFGGGALFFLLNGMRTITSLTIENMQNQQVEEEAANYQAQSSY